MRMQRGATKDTHGQTLGALCGVLAIATVLAACGGGNQAGTMTSFSSAGNAAAQPELFSLPADQIAHIQVVQVAQAPFERTLRLTGAVEYNSFKTTPVITQVGGPVSRILVAPGEQVTAGQPMLYVTSPDYSQLRSTYLKSRDAFRLAQKQYVRAKDLYAHQAIAQADLEQAESTQTQAEADFDSSADAMRVLGISDPESIVGRPVSAELPLLAPLAGEVVERLCSPGQLLQAGGTQCFTLSDTSSVWVLVNVYQNDLSLRARRRGCLHRRRILPRRRAWEDRIFGPRTGPHHAHAAGAHRGAQSR